MENVNYDSREAYNDDDMALWLHFADSQARGEGLEEWLSEVDPFCGWVDAMEQDYSEEDVPW
jgi:hypothetical protein